MSSDRLDHAAHWSDAYADGDSDRSWYQVHARTSVSLIGHAHGPTASVIDVGGGASTLVDDLLDAGYPDVSVLDIAESSLQIARRRLGSQAARVTWIAEDLLSWIPSRTYDVWHDRAVLHFLSESEAQQYRQVLQRATRPGSVVVVGVFGPAGPTRCSGLPVRRYDADALRAFLGAAFETLAESREVHTTPAGMTQEFQWIVARRID